MGDIDISLSDDGKPCSPSHDWKPDSVDQLQSRTGVSPSRSAASNAASLARIHRIHDEHYSPRMQSEEFLAIRCAPPIMREQSRQALQEAEGSVQQAISTLESD